MLVTLRKKLLLIKNNLLCSVSYYSLSGFFPLRTWRNFRCILSFKILVFYGNKKWVTKRQQSIVNEWWNIPYKCTIIMHPSIFTFYSIFGRLSSNKFQNTSIRYTLSLRNAVPCVRLFSNTYFDKFRMHHPIPKALRFAKHSYKRNEWQNEIWVTI